MIDILFLVYLNFSMKKYAYMSQLCLSYLTNISNSIVPRWVASNFVSFVSFVSYEFPMSVLYCIVPTMSDSWDFRDLGHLGAIRHCWKHLQQPGTAWNNVPWGHCPLSQGAKLHRLDRPSVYNQISLRAGVPCSYFTFQFFYPRLRQ